MTEDNNSQLAPWGTVESEIEGLLARVGTSSFYKLKQEFQDKSRRWFFSGQGRSGLIAQMVAMRFMQLGIRTHVVGEVTAPSVRAGDGFLLVCGSGETPISVAFATTAKEAGAMLVVISHKPNSKVAQMADLLICIPMERSVQFGGTLFEQCGLIIFDSLAMELASCEGPEAHSQMWLRHTNMQ